MKRHQRYPRWIVAKRMRKRAKRGKGKTHRVHCSVQIKWSK